MSRVGSAGRALAVACMLAGCAENGGCQPVPLSFDDGEDDSTGAVTDPYLAALGAGHFYIELDVSFPYEVSQNALLGRVEVSLVYSPCLVDFYTRRPEYRADGELGRAYFGNDESGWYDVGSPVYEFLEIWQDFSEPPRLRASVEASSTPIEVGPLPVPELAECDEPYVAASRHVPIHGVSPDGQRTWTMVYAELDRAYASFDDGLMSIHVNAREDE